MKKHGSHRAGKQKAPAPTSDSSSQHMQIPASLSSAINPNLSPSVPTSLQHSIGSHRQAAPKVAIPRLRRGSDDQPVSKASTTADKHRVTHACEPCRHRKTKCSGERPACLHCQDFRLRCVYADGKRDRTRKQLGSLAGRVEEYERLLEDLWNRVGKDDRKLIRTALDKETYSDDDDEQSILSPRPTSIYREPAGEHKVSARVGSTESLDQIDEDFNRNSAARATGFHGKNSEITWMQRLQRGSTEDSDEYALDPGVDGQNSPASKTHHLSSGNAPISESSYHCDDMTVLISEQVDPYEVPPQATADKLFKSYLDTVHPAFPIVGKQTFSDQYKAFSASANKMKINQSWLAILNLIFAIGAKYSHLIQAEWRGDPRDHLIYFTRARILGFHGYHVLGHAELQRVQITGLMTFYLMAINQINRSWVVSGIAIRHASTLGLNLRNASKDVQEASREIRYRVWWALCSIERGLAVMTGRPTSFAETDCTAPLPLPLEEDSLYSTASTSPQVIRTFRRMSSQESRQNDKSRSSPSSSSHSSKARGSPASSMSLMSPTLQSSSQEMKQAIPPSSALAFGFSTRLSTFTNEVLNRLYRADAMDQSWAHVQGTITSLNLKLEKLQSELPPIFDFSKKQRDQQFMPQRLGLGFFYYSTSMIINRPCLCRIDRKIPNESGKARDFNRETAARCVHAARDMLGLLPDEPNPVGLYKVAPWWCLVHYLMQAATVMMLEMSFRADHMPTEVEDVFNCAKKALEWLRSMADNDEAARRASVLCNDVLHKVASKVGRNPNEASDFGSHRSQGMENVQSMQDGHIDPSEPAQYQSQYAYTTSAPFQPQIFTSYDQFLSYNNLPTTSGAPVEEMFPTANEMDNMNFEDPGFFQGPDQRWFPSSSASDGFLH